MHIIVEIKLDMASNKKPKAKLVDKTTTKAGSKIVKDLDSFKNDMDDLFIKHNINRALLIVQQPVGKNEVIMSLAHIKGANYDDELEFANAGLNLFTETGTDPGVLDAVALIVKEAKKPKTKYSQEIQEAEKKLSPSQMAELTKIRENKLECVKKQQYEEACNWRNKELKFLKIKKTK